MKLIQTLDTAVNGYWDGGPKSRFEWTIQGLPRTDAKGQFVRIGSYGANFWFHVSLGKTDRATLGKARSYLARKTKAPCTFEIVEEKTRN